MRRTEETLRNCDNRNIAKSIIRDKKSREGISKAQINGGGNPYLASFTSRARNNIPFRIHNTVLAKRRIIGENSESN